VLEELGQKEIEGVVGEDILNIENYVYKKKYVYQKRPKPFALGRKSREDWSWLKKPK